MREPVSAAEARIVTSPTGTCERRRLVVEATALGLAYGAGLCLAGAWAVASFRVEYLAQPYWSAVPALRTDTCGALAFFVAAICLAVAEYLRLERRRYVLVRSPVSPAVTAAHSAILALAETIATMSTGLVAYLSVNAVTHPWTLQMQATHLARWPSEGTLRVLALAGCITSVSMIRYLRVSRHRSDKLSGSAA
jgi:hypothetical protein